ncbi:FtsW/RodA/SpoVE family cell cycle protein [Anaeromicropila populeti]|uniref:Probable peptidoglycan glycosyltransferase FtsW n=1 Tax=Anaeromicropila populeti TaxID=37658 RepID=A0A1I6KWY0_9FIRM|nr:putative peptidoglycan glycosyltransferase FtsW [Anaeromicropila populeti]SFR95721.1 cell division protein FtsW [Anaeromicropila populeti]
MTKSEQERMNGKKKINNYYDYSLLFLTIFLSCFGMVMIYSTSSYTAQVKFSDPTYFLKKQLVSVILGVIAMLAVSKIDYRILMKKAGRIPFNLVTLAYLMAIILQTYVLFFGKEFNGAKRWISLGPFGTFQPSEFTKVVAIIFVSYIVNKLPRSLNRVSGFIRVMILASPLIFLIVIENLSTALVVSAIVVGICFVASRKKWYYFFFGFLFVGMVVAYIFLGDEFRSVRIDVWRNVETHPLGFQILQGLYAIASGGVFGTGLGESMQKLGFIPESHNDMIFSIICEELGLFGAIAVVLLFVLLIWRLFIISINAPDLFGGLICSGVLIHIAVQVIINVAVVTNSIPSTGIPLPFISYGGTSVAILLAEMGLALSVSNQIRSERI